MAITVSIFNGTVNSFFSFAWFFRNPDHMLILLQTWFLIAADYFSVQDS